MDKSEKYINFFPNDSIDCDYIEIINIDITEDTVYCDYYWKWPKIQFDYSLFIVCLQFVYSLFIVCVIKISLVYNEVYIDKKQ